jgi:RNA-directed DNA polymerase
VVQTAAKIVLEPIFEEDFEDSDGYRPCRSAIDAIKETHPQIGGAASSTETCCG